jgi:hypothetical protein
MADEINFRWVEFDGKRVAVSEGGRVFVHVPLESSGAAVIESAAFMGEPVIYAEGGAYLPADWIADQWPEIAPSMELTIRMAREASGDRQWPRLEGYSPDEIFIPAEFMTSLSEAEWRTLAANGWDLNYDQCQRLWCMNNRNPDRAPIGATLVFTEPPRRRGEPDPWC